MPLTFVYLIGIGAAGLLALVMPHYGHLSFVMTGTFSIFMIPIGIIEAIRNRRLD